MSVLEISIRPMELGDIGRVYAIDAMSFNLPWTERSYRFELTENRNSSPWVAEAADSSGMRQIAGMLVNWIILDEVHVATIAVHPSFRGQGIARRLLAHGLLAAYERGARLAYLEVRRGNLAAQALYARFGFSVTSVRKGYYKDNNEDALLMTLTSLDVERLKILAETENA